MFKASPGRLENKTDELTRSPNVKMNNIFKTHCLITARKISSRSLVAGHPSIKRCIRLFAAVWPHSLIKSCASPPETRRSHPLPKPFVWLSSVLFHRPAWSHPFYRTMKVNIFITLRGTRYGRGGNISDCEIWKQYSLFESWLVVDDSGEKEKVKEKGKISRCLKP